MGISRKVFPQLKTSLTLYNATYAAISSQKRHPKYKNTRFTLEENLPFATDKPEWADSVTVYPKVDMKD